MAGLDKRIEALERLYATGESSGLEPKQQERRAELLASVQRARERATLEAAAGDTRRLHALEDLERHMQERIERRQGNSGGA
jgi:hypothetical protein